MLTEVIQARPDLVPFHAIGGGATETFVRGVLWCNPMYTFLVPFEIVVGAKAICLGASRFLTLVRPGVSEHMFPSMKNQQRMTRLKRDTHLCSDEFLNVLLQSEFGHVEGYIFGPSCIDSLASSKVEYWIS